MPDANVLNSKRVVYVGGLADEVTIPLLRACMIPFGPIHSIDMVCFAISPSNFQVTSAMVAVVLVFY